MHIQACHPVAVQQQQQAQVKMEKLDRPKLHLRDGMAEEEDWSFFCHRWKSYKAQANIRTSSVECLASCIECLCNTHVYMERRKMDDCVLCERESGMKG